MARTNRRYASARMKAHNPMHDDDTRERMAATLRDIGHAPRVRGGNGRPVPEPQRLLAEALGSAWVTELIVPTREPRESGYPPHYKIDVGHPLLDVAVEVDGGSHCARVRKAQDAKKTAFLESLGWLVIRFTNAEALADPRGCAAHVSAAALAFINRPDPSPDDTAAWTVPSPRAVADDSAEVPF